MVKAWREEKEIRENSVNAEQSSRNLRVREGTQSEFPHPTSYTHPPPRFYVVLNQFPKDECLSLPLGLSQIRFISE